MALSKNTTAIKDGNGTLLPGGAGTCTDGTNTFPATGLLGSDGTHFLPSGDDPTRPIYTAASVSSNAYESKPAVTRPANTTAYTAGDVVGGSIPFTNIGPSGGMVVIQTTSLRVDVAAVPTGMTNFLLHLYDATPPSAPVDNAAWDLPSGDRVNYLGYVDLGTPVDLGSTLFVQSRNVGVEVKLATGSTTLYGLLQTVTGFTPAANSEVYTPRLATVGV